YEGAAAHSGTAPLPEPKEQAGGIQLVAYKPLFSGPAVERVSELQFQRPASQITLSRADARDYGIAEGDAVTVSSDRTSAEWTAQLSNRLRAGVALVARERSSGLSGPVTLAISPTKEAKSQ